MKQVTWIVILFSALFTHAQNIPSYIPTTGLAAYYPLNGNANDQSTNALNGTINGATLTTDKLGASNSAYLFDGSSDYIEVADHAALDFSNSMSLTAWFKTTDSNIVNQGILGKGRATGGTGYNLIFHNTAGNISFGINDGVQDLLASTSITGYGVGWHFIVGTYDAYNLKLYIDNVLVGTQQGTISANNSTMPLFIGKETISGSIRYFKGSIDEVALYNRPLTISEISLMYSRALSVHSSTLKESFFINPNPASDMVIIRTSIIGVMNYQLINITGEVIKTIEINSDKTSLFIGDLPSGIYFIRCSDNGSILKFIKN
jgi:hypothetical protein